MIYEPYIVCAIITTGISVSHIILVSYPDHLDLDSALEKGPDLRGHFLPCLSHCPQSLQLLKCSVRLQQR